MEDTVKKAEGDTEEFTPEEKSQEMSILESGHINHSILDSIDNAIHIIDRQFRIIYANKRFNGWLKQFGLPDVISGGLLNEAFPFLSDKVYDEYRLVFETGETVITEEKTKIDRTEFITETKKFPVLEKGKILNVVTIIKDLTESKKTQKKLASEKNKLQSLIDSLEYGLTIQDRGYNILFQNEFMKKIFVNTWGKCYQVYESRDNVCDGCPVRLSFLDGMSHKTERQVITQSGETVILDITSTPIRDAEGNVVSCFEMTQDITGRRRAEEDRERLRSQLSQAQKMESVGRLAGGVAHDFNNMLSVIIGYTDLTLNQLGAASPLYAKIQEIRKAAGRSADLTRQLLAFARKQTVSPRALNLNDTVESMFKMLRRLIGEDIDLAWLPSAKIWPTYIDPSQIDQILANLCVNARDAISGVGKITIATNTATIDESYLAGHPDAASGDYIVLSVSDTGSGMDKETLDNLFEPFFTTKERGKGTGLGLATVYGIVKQNNGFIDVYSEPGRGTTFKIYLPRLTDGIRQPPEESHDLRPSFGNETILLVEDEPAILDIERLMLENLGYSVLVASTPNEAIRMAREYEGKIQLLVTDVIMPEMNGRELANNLVSLCPGIKLLFMSGYTGDLIAHHGVLDDGVNFIEKPFSVQRLAAKVREALDGK